MGHHINKDGDFQSDKHPELPPNKIALDFRDAFARPVLLQYANNTLDKELSSDIIRGLTNTRDRVKVPGMD